jgi:hypothetical protein
MLMRSRFRIGAMVKVSLERGAGRARGPAPTGENPIRVGADTGVCPRAGIAPKTRQMRASQICRGDRHTHTKEPNHALV